MAMKKIILALFITLCFTSSLFARPLNLNEITQASVRVSTGSSWGSGTCVYFDGKSYYILTNAHVVGNSPTASVEFFSQGWKTSFISGSVIWKRFEQMTDVDFAIVKIAKEKLGEYRPRVIPLLPAKYTVRSNEYIASVGCPEARWAQAFEGRFIGGDDSRLLFTPPPRPGQSGSGIHVIMKAENGEYYTYVGAIITWLIGNSSGKDANGFDIAQGGAIPISTLYRVLDNRTNYKPNKVPSHYQYVNSNRADHVHYYALGDDGTYYLMKTNENTGRRYANVRTGVCIIKWGIPFG
jgi:hypothetical protein